MNALGVLACSMNAACIPEPLGGIGSTLVSLFRTMLNKD
jgi:hypothetical protein